MVNVENKENILRLAVLSIITVIVTIRQWLLYHIMTGKPEMMT